MKNYTHFKKVIFAFAILISGCEPYCPNTAIIDIYNEDKGSVYLTNESKNWLNVRTIPSYFMMVNDTDYIATFVNRSEDPNNYATIIDNEGFERLVVDSKEYELRDDCAIHRYNNYINAEYREEYYNTDDIKYNIAYKIKKHFPNFPNTSTHTDVIEIKAFGFSVILNPIDTKYKLIPSVTINGITHQNVYEIETGEKDENSPNYIYFNINIGVVGCKMANGRQWVMKY